ncbi:hypothetical protein EVAR_12929_1 [Eumeta japonica]|uniref:Uncharacterized protein n=1 Tax=Eumeta variegata TaxID=151549 RepID=A0A4C1TWW3_EUMVA|nr:hypothetical protein EVAR_12929_1 [Eumeta japonica]
MHKILQEPQQFAHSRCAAGPRVRRAHLVTRSDKPLPAISVFDVYRLIFKITPQHLLRNRSHFDKDYVLQGRHVNTRASRLEGGGSTKRKTSTVKRKAATVHNAPIRISQSIFHSGQAVVANTEPDNEKSSLSMHVGSEW